MLSESGLGADLSLDFGCVFQPENSVCLNCFYFLLGIGSRIVVVLELGVLFGGVFIEILGGAAMTYKGVNQILYGGDYNPEQWAEEVWLEDMQLSLIHI